MPWVKLSDDFSDSPKLGMIEPEHRPFAVELYIAGLCYCARMLTDGFIPAGHLRRLADFEAHGIQPRTIAAVLIVAGLWQEAERGYRVHDFLEYNKSRERVVREREEWRERQDRHRQVSRRDTPRDYHRESDGPVPVPVPVPKTVGKTPTPREDTGAEEAVGIVEAAGHAINPTQARKLAATFTAASVLQEAERLAAEVQSGLEVRSFHALLKHRLENPEANPTPGTSGRSPDGLTREELSVYDDGI